MLVTTLLRPSGRTLQASLFRRTIATSGEEALSSGSSEQKKNANNTQESDLPSPQASVPTSEKLTEKPTDQPTEQPIEQPIEQTSERNIAKQWPLRLDDAGQKFRLPRSVQALYLRPLRRQAQYGLPVCDLQLRSYSVRNVEFFADFAIRAAYYLKLPVSGPIPLPRIVERWTFPRSNFVHKKSQENFERITLRRLIQIKDGHPETVQMWLAFLRRHAFYGVGMKANVWDFDDLDVAQGLDVAAEEVNKTLEPYFEQFGQRHDGKANPSVESLLDNERFSNFRAPLTEVRKG